MQRVFPKLLPKLFVFGRFFKSLAFWKKRPICKMFWRVLKNSGVKQPSNSSTRSLRAPHPGLFSRVTYERNKRRVARPPSASRPRVVILAKAGDPSYLFFQARGLRPPRRQRLLAVTAAEQHGRLGSVERNPTPIARLASRCNLWHPAESC